MGLSPRELQQDNAIDPHQFAVHAGLRVAAARRLRCARTRLGVAVGTLEAIRRGQSHGEITDVITPKVRWALLVDSAALTLADIGVAIAELPPTTDPRFASLAEPLRQRMAALESSLATAGAEGSEVADMLDTIARVYTHLLVRPAPRGPARPRTGTR
jgi:hypothetical protein